MALDDSGEGNMAVVDSVLRICVWRREVEKTGPDTPAIQGIIALHTALLEGGGQECAEAE